MHFLVAAAAFAVILPTALAVDSNPYNTSAGACASNCPGGLDFYSVCWEYEGCVWEPAIDDKGKPIPGAEQCSCNDNPDNWADLIWFYTKMNYKGDLIKGFGHYGECQDLPTAWYALTESVQMASVPPAYCTLYTQSGCSMASGAASTTRDTSKASENAIAEFTGWYRKGVRSWKCVKK